MQKHIPPKVSAEEAVGAGEFGLRIRRRAFLRVGGVSKANHGSLGLTAQIRSRESNRSIQWRLKKLSYGLSSDHCDPVLVAQKVCADVYKGVTTSQLDELAAETAAALTANHPDYASLAARIAVSNLHKNTKKSFSETVKDMYRHVNERSGLEAVYACVRHSIRILEAALWRKSVWQLGGLHGESRGVHGGWFATVTAHGG